MGAFGCVVLLSLAILSPFAKANPESDALNAFKNVLKDPNNALESWDTTLVDPCTWFHVTCDADNFVTRVPNSHTVQNGCEHKASFLRAHNLCVH
ncbi:hypothetical protein LIER_34547 [Lithospermum erythrorhizon]|uniref:Leucine-rich repeat-containing N-terminal plant-type domain-containing protein n=1 Tax=Lithospermum erythrorhizon TaxID=34254 RepID=A0AAV3S1Y5_LITER